MMRHAAAIVIVLVFNAASVRAQDTTFTVRHESADVYKGPSTGAAIIGHVRQGAVLPVTRELGSWVKISWPAAPDGVGYVHVTMGTIGHGGSMTEDASQARSVQPPTSTTRRTPQSTSRPAAENGSPSERLPQAVPLQPVFVTPMTHMIGVGGRLAGPAIDYGATARVWRRSRLGVQLDVSRYAMTSASAPGRMTSTQIEPSMLYALPDRIGDYLWLRPYIGAGLSLRDQTLSSVGAPAAASVVDRGIGTQAFGGAELTFAAVPQFAVSVELAGRWSRTAFTAFDPGPVGVSLAGHWYVK